MKKITRYINTMYRPSFIALSIGLTFISLTLIALAIIMRESLIAGERLIVYQFPSILEELILRSVILFSVIFAVDLNERKKGG